MKSQIVGFFPDSFHSSVSLRFRVPHIKGSQSKQKPTFSRELFNLLWCPKRDSNPHTRRQRILSPPRLPFRHQGIYFLFLEINSAYPSRMSCRFTDACTREYGSHCFRKGHTSIIPPSGHNLFVWRYRMEKEGKVKKIDFYFPPFTFPPSIIQISFLRARISPITVSILSVIV